MCCAAQDRPNETPEAAAVRRAAEAYIAALHRGDEAQLMASWTAEGDFVDAAGRTMKGRDMARQSGRRPDQGRGADEPAITVNSIRFVSSDVAVEDGTVESPLGDSGFAVARYTAIWVKREGRWLLDSLRESGPSEGSHHDRLRALGWMVGDWVERGGIRNVELVCRWTPDGNFLLRDMKIQTPEGQTVSVTQRIGWDAAREQITAWTFDSDGGHGIGAWSRQGDQWIVRSTGVLPDGQTASSTSTYARNGEDAFVWESTHSVGGGSAPAVRKMELVRRNAAANPNRARQ